MAKRPASASFMTPKKKGGTGSYQKKKRRQDLRRKAMQAGQSDFLTKFPFLKSAKDPWTLERSKRQEEIRLQYGKDRRRMLIKKKSAEREMRRLLMNEKIEIDNKYQLHKLKEGDPRRKKALKKAEDKYKKIELIEERKFDRMWNTQRGSVFKGLQSQKRKDYSRITKDMRRESRVERGLPGQKEGLF